MNTHQLIPNSETSKSNNFTNIAQIGFEFRRNSISEVAPKLSLLVFETNKISPCMPGIFDNERKEGFMKRSSYDVAGIHITVIKSASLSSEN